MSSALFTNLFNNSLAGPLSAKIKDNRRVIDAQKPFEFLSSCHVVFAYLDGNRVKSC